MKIFVFNYRKDDEEEFFELFSNQYNVSLGISEKTPTVKTAMLAKGYDCVSVITSKIDAPILEQFKEAGVRFISTRTIGYDHIDLEKAKELGIKVGNATYSPSSVADYAIMLILMSLRKIKLILNRSSYQNFKLDGVRGKELPKLTVGIVGTGRIGSCVIEHLSGFGCKLLAYDLVESEKVKNYATYGTVKQLIAESDIITLHAPSTDDNFHLINEESIKMMKDQVVIVNTARGSLIDTKALIKALEEGKIGAAALDVIEDETHIYYKDYNNKIIMNRDLLLLKSYPNVILTPHTAFYTDQAVSDMVENSIKSCILFLEEKENPWEVA